MPTARGAWATHFEGGKDPREWTWFVAFMADSGERLQHPGNFIEDIDKQRIAALYTGKGDLFEAATYQGPIALQVVSDYDGDGVAEIVVWTAQIGEEGRTSARGTLWSLATRGRLGWVSGHLIVSSR